jgi:sialate O-acetylesterase
MNLRIPSTVFLFAAVTTVALADVKLPTVLDSHMVVQRDRPVRIWGTADSGENVTVTLGDETKKATADDAGNWLVELSEQEADGKARQIKVAGNNEIVLDDVLVGEIWIGSGQSNMEWQLQQTDGAKEAIASANHPNIRLYHVPKVQQDAPATDIQADWKTCTPENVPAFSAVLYYFGKKLGDELDVPIGLINSSWGGSPIEPWTIKDGKSGGMYNGMIAPLTNLSVQGAIWYQGETNVIAKNKFAYADKMTDLIQGWRQVFRDDALEFFYVQIAPWSGSYEPGQLPALWEAQAATLKLPLTGMAVTTDLVDNIADIHPRNKLDVGNRLSRWALNETYGRDDVVVSGPLFKTAKKEGSKLRLSFAHSKGLKSRDGKPLSEFQIADDSREFFAATAEVDGDSILVSADSVANPTQARFGWHKLTNPNLINEAGLPASPFQTNNWRGGTGE